MEKLGYVRRSEVKRRRTTAYTRFVRPLIEIPSCQQQTQRTMLDWPQKQKLKG